MLDLRIPIGWFFLLNALVLILTGVFAPVSTTVGTMSINLNLWWGMCLALFGSFMLGLSKLDRSAKSAPAKGTTAPLEGPPATSEE